MRTLVIGIVGVILAAVAPARADFVVHEWGTFTTRHGGDGQPIVWNPLAGVRDLPRFVSTNPRFPKASIAGTVRMETPVIYFYPDDRLSVVVDVAFPGGEVTEWYPRGRIREHGISWPQVMLLPGASARLAHGRKESHY
jgi:hypothetical protein